MRLRADRGWRSGDQLSFGRHELTAIRGDPISTGSEGRPLKPFNRLLHVAMWLGIPLREKSPLPHQLPYRPDIDGLRAVAIISVVAFHAFPMHLRGGFIGVDVFFVISGFLISSLLYQSTGKGDFSYLAFYARRIRRILPALLLVLAASLVIGWLFLLPNEYAALSKLVLGGALSIPNILIWKQTGYFSASAENTPLLHLWSLGVEEQFYLLWPLFVVTFRRRHFLLIAIALAALSFGANVFFIRDYTAEVFYFPVTRFWELLCGALLAWRERGHTQSNLGVEMLQPRWLREILSMAGLVAIMLCCLRFNSNLSFPGWYAAIPVMATMMIIAAGPDTLLNKHVLANPFCVFIGLISYPLYLWHWPILSFLNVIGGEQYPVRGVRFAAVGISFLLAWATYLLVERPVRKATTGYFRRMAVGALLAGTLLIALLGAMGMATQGFPSRFPPQVARLTASKPDISGFREGSCFLRPEQDFAAWAPSCIEPPHDDAPLVVLWGDSHAAHLQSGLSALESRLGFRLAQMTASGCPPQLNVNIVSRPHCKAVNAEFLEKIKTLHPSLVILAADWYDNDVRFTAPSIAELKRSGIRNIVLVGPVPLWFMDLPNLLARVTLLKGGQVPARLSNSFRRSVNEQAFLDFARMQHVRYASPLSVLCRDDGCVTMTGASGVIAFDRAHLTSAGSVYLMKRLQGQLFAGIK